MVIGVKYNQEILKYMKLFENITGTRLKDCFEDKKGVINFFVDERMAGKAIGKNGLNVRRISEALNRKIRIVAYSDDLKTFLNNLLFPNIVEDIEINDSIVILRDRDFQKKSRIIGSKASNLRNYEYIVQRFFPYVEEIKVV